MYMQEIYIIKGHDWDDGYDDDVKKMILTSSAQLEISPVWFYFSTFGLKEYKWKNWSLEHVKLSWEHIKWSLDYITSTSEHFWSSWVHKSKARNILSW